MHLMELPKAPPPTHTQFLIINQKEEEENEEEGKERGKEKEEENELFP